MKCSSKKGVLTDEIESEYRKELKELIQSSFDIAQNEPLITSDEDKEEEDVFAPYIQNVIEGQGNKKEIRFIDAIQQSLNQSMERYQDWY